MRDRDEWLKQDMVRSGDAWAVPRPDRRQLRDRRAVPRGGRRKSDYPEPTSPTSDDNSDPDVARGAYVH